MKENQLLQRKLRLRIIWGHIYWDCDNLCVCLCCLRWKCSRPIWFEIFFSKALVNVELGEGCGDWEEVSFGALVFHLTWPAQLTFALLWRYISEPGRVALYKLSTCLSLNSENLIFGDLMSALWLYKWQMTTSLAVSWSYGFCESEVQAQVVLLVPCLGP